MNNLIAIIQTHKVDERTARKILSAQILADVKARRITKRQKAGNRYDAKAKAAALKGEY
jgi:hypothetical protein